MAPVSSVTTTDDPRSPRHTSNSAKRQRAFHSAKDYETSASQLGDVLPPQPDERSKVMRLVATNVPKDEVVEMLMMLGIHPDQPDWDEVPSLQPSSAKGM